MRNARIGGAELKGADLRAADLTGVDFSNLTNIAGADFSLAQGLSEAAKAQILSYPTTDLNTWNPYTRKTTQDSLS